VKKDDREVLAEVKENEDLKDIPDSSTSSRAEADILRS